MPWLPAAHLSLMCTCGHAAKDHSNTLAHWCNQCPPTNCYDCVCAMYCFYGCYGDFAHCDPVGSPGEQGNCTKFVLDPSQLESMIAELREIAAT